MVKGGSNIQSITSEFDDGEVIRTTDIVKISGRKKCEKAKKALLVLVQIIKEITVDVHIELSQEI